MKEDKAVGFLLAYPDGLARPAKNARAAFPFGWLTLLLELRRTDRIKTSMGRLCCLNIAAQAAQPFLYSEMFKSVTENPRYKHAEVVQVGVENENMQRDMENFGIDFYKMHRTYQRAL